MDRKSALKQGVSWIIGSPDVAPHVIQSAVDEPALTTLTGSMSIDPFVPSPGMPWDRRRILHLARRMGLTPSPETVHVLSGFSPSQAVDHLITQALNARKIAEPIWSNIGVPPASASEQERQAYLQQRALWTTDLRDILVRHILDTGLHGKLTLFWHNHFVTEFSDYGNNPQYAWRYLKTIQDHQFGSFKQLTLSMGLTPAMLLYLNGNQNQRVSPNENYARELLELFTLGEGNGYTQGDIEEMARALTGYQVNGQTLSVTFNGARHDTGTKTLFGTSGNFNYASAHEVLFQERREGIAQHICREIYQFFVYPNAPQPVVDALADIFLDSGMQMEPLLRTLFKSRHFFDDELIGSMVSSPVEHFGHFLGLIQVSRSTTLIQVSRPIQELRNMFNYTSQTGQSLLQPPDVSGWKGHRNWLDTSTLPTRWNLMQQMVSQYRTLLWEFAKRMPNPNNPYQLAKDIAEWMIAVPLPEDEYTTLANVLLGGSPSYEWRIDSDGAASRVQALVAYIVLMPEFQLN